MEENRIMKKEVGILRNEKQREENKVAGIKVINRSKIRGRAGDRTCGGPYTRLSIKLQKREKTLG